MDATPVPAREIDACIAAAQDLRDALDHYSDIAPNTEEHVTYVRGWCNSLRALETLVRLELQRTR
jgi:hypothetical protein